MAGHFDRGDVIIDTHEGPIIDPVWDLYRFTMEEIGRPVSTLIEWDTHVPPLADVVAEATKAQEIMEKLGFSASPPAPRHPLPAQEGLGDAIMPLAERHEAVSVR